MPEEPMLELEAVAARPALGQPERLPDNTTVYYITGEVIPDTVKEQVRQRTARLPIFEFGVDPDDTKRDFPVRVVTSVRAGCRTPS